MSKEEAIKACERIMKLGNQKILPSRLRVQHKQEDHQTREVMWVIRNPTAAALFS